MKTPALSIAALAVAASLAPLPAHAGRVPLDADGDRSSSRDAGKVVRFRTASPFVAKPLQTWPVRNAGRSTAEGYRWRIAQEQKERAAEAKKKPTDPVMEEIGGDLDGGSDGTGGGGNGTGNGIGPGTGNGNGNGGSSGDAGGGNAGEPVAVPTPSAALAGVLGIGALIARRRTRA